MSNFYRNNYVICDEQVRRVINVNDRIAEKMQTIVKQQQLERREELLRQRMEAGEDGEIEFTEGLFAEELELEGLELEGESEPQIDYVAQAQEEAEQILANANSQAVQIHDQAMQEAEIIRETARQEGYASGYETATMQAEEELRVQREALEQQAQEQQVSYEEALQELEPKLLDTILTVFDEVFQMQFRGKQEMLQQLVMNAVRGIRETRSYKLRVCEAEVAMLRAYKSHIQEKVGEDVQIEIVMDPDLTESQCVIDADSGVYECSLDVQLENLIRDLRSLCAIS